MCTGYPGPQSLTFQPRSRVCLCVSLHSGKGLKTSHTHLIQYMHTCRIEHLNLSHMTLLDLHQIHHSVKARPSMQLYIQDITLSLTSASTSSQLSATSLSSFSNSIVLSERQRATYGYQVWSQRARPIVGARLRVITRWLRMLRAGSVCQSLSKKFSKCTIYGFTFIYVRNVHTLLCRPLIHWLDDAFRPRPYY